MENDWTEIYTKYKGLWVALLEDGNTVVGSGKTPEVALAKAEKKGHPDAYLMSVPQETFNFVGVSWYGKVFSSILSSNSI